MLSSVHRLRRSADFQHVVRRGRRASSATVVVHGCRRASAMDRCLVGFIVSRRVGNAVTRNLVKRRLREAMRARVSHLDGHLFVVRANPAASHASFAQLNADLDRCLTTMTSPTDEGRGR